MLAAAGAVVGLAGRVVLMPLIALRRVAVTPLGVRILQRSAAWCGRVWGSPCSC